MTDLDDKPLARTPSSPVESAAGAPGPRPPAALIVGGLLILAAIGFGLRWWLADRQTPETAAAPPATAAPVAATEAPLTPAAEPPVVLPPIDEMDPFIRGLLGALSARPELARWLATDDLIRHLALAIDRVSRGVSPAGEFGMLAPASGYPTVSRQRRLHADPAGYTRYDGIVSTIGALDMTAVARAYRTLQPRLDEAYRGLGRPGRTVDRAVQDGLALLLATPVPPESPELDIGEGPNYVYADLELEGLQPPQKHLLRMGPAHVRTIKTKLEELRQALATTPSIEYRD